MLYVADCPIGKSPVNPSYRIARRFPSVRWESKAVWFQLPKRWEGLESVLLPSQEVGIEALQEIAHILETMD